MVVHLTILHPVVYLDLKETFPVKRKNCHSHNPTSYYPLMVCASVIRVSLLFTVCTKYLHNFRGKVSIHKPGFKGKGKEKVFVVTKNSKILCLMYVYEKCLVHY